MKITVNTKELGIIWIFQHDSINMPLLLNGITTNFEDLAITTKYKKWKEKTLGRENEV